MNKIYVFFDSFDIDIIKPIDYNEIVRNHNSDNLREVLYALLQKRS